jgi:hypothetical protein
MKNLNEIIEEGRVNFDKLNTLVHMLTYEIEIEKKLELKSQIMKILIDCQVLSNDFIINLNK